MISSTALKHHMPYSVMKKLHHITLNITALDPAQVFTLHSFCFIGFAFIQRPSLSLPFTHISTQNVMKGQNVQSIPN